MTTAVVRYRWPLRLRVSLAVLTGITAATLLVPLLSPYGYEQQNLALGASAPGWDHWMGTDLLGRDLLVRTMFGGRISLSVGLVATAVAMLIGVLWGGVAGYLGGRTDSLMMRAVDVAYGLPFIAFVILLTVVFGHSLLLIFVAIGAVEWLTIARIVRAQVVALKHREFVLAARALGVPGWRIILRHLIPNSLGVIVIYATLTIPGVMILEAFLSLLGLGVQPPMSSWGLLIRYGVASMEEYPWLLLFPAGLFSLTLFSLNFVGDGLRDLLDPRYSRDQGW